MAFKKTAGAVEIGNKWKEITYVKDELLKIIAWFDVTAIKNADI